MSAIRNLCNKNHTIVSTIHQPSEDILALFNVLLLMAAGRIIYFGPASEVISYFADSPFHFHYREGDNPADYAVAVANAFIHSDDGRVIQSSELADYYLTTIQAKTVFSFYLNEGKPIVGTLTNNSPPKRIVGIYITPIYHHLPVLLYRRFLILRKNPVVLFAPIARYDSFLYTPKYHE